MKNIKKIISFTLLVSSITLSNSLSAYIHTVINEYSMNVKVTANTIVGPDKSITVASSPSNPVHAQLDTGDLCIRGFKVEAYKLINGKKRKLNLGNTKTESVTTDILGSPAIARGCMNYQLTIKKDGTLLLERMGD